MAKYEQTFSVTGSAPPPIEDWKLMGAALAKCFDEVGLVWVSGKTFAGWADVATADFGPSGDTWSVYKLPDIDNDKRSHPVYVRFSLARSYWAYGEGLQYGLLVRVGYDQSFSSGSSTTNLATYFDNNVAANPFSAFAFYADSRLTFGYSANGQKCTAIHAVERSRSRTTWANDDGLFHGAFSPRSNSTTDRNVTTQWSVITRDPFKLWSTASFAQSAAYFTQIFPRPLITVGPTVASGVAHCQPVYWYNRGVLEQATTLTAVPSALSPNSVTVVENGMFSYTVRTPRYTNWDGLPYTWAHRWE